MLILNNHAVSDNLVSGMMNMHQTAPNHGNSFGRFNQDSLLVNQVNNLAHTQQRGPPQLYTQVPQEFAYNAASQENGVLHYLGTLGYSSPWANPDSQRK